MGLKKQSRDGLIQSLEDQGYKFAHMQMVSEGDYAVDDSDWNYKDIPHLHHVHALAEAMPAVIGGDVICSINLQKILGIWFPIAVVNYEYEKLRQVYFTTLAFFALVVETRSEALAPNRTRVTTRYAIGYPPLLFFLVPIMKALIRKNYRVLMSEDLPMRDRRGALREAGYLFRKPGETYAFDQTVNIMQRNVLPPPNAERTLICNYQTLLAQGETALVGDIGLLGFRVVRVGDEVAVHRRTCPHEGAGLDDQPCGLTALTCRWHGRKLEPIARFAWGADADVESREYRVRVRAARITVTYIGDAPVSAQAASEIDVTAG